MEFFTERYHLRRAIIQTSMITVDMYGMLLSRCARYYNNLTWLFPRTWEANIVVLDTAEFIEEVSDLIPDLYIDEEQNISVPSEEYAASDDYLKYSQYALIDFIEFLANNIRDESSQDRHSEGIYSNRVQNSIEINETVVRFRRDINRIFKKTGLLFTLKEDLKIEPLEGNAILSDAPH
jgi:hypothetical protein